MFCRSLFAVAFSFALSFFPIDLISILPQYDRLFNTTRIPGEETDTLITQADSTHIVVLYRDEALWMDTTIGAGIQYLEHSSDLKTLIDGFRDAVLT